MNISQNFNITAVIAVLWAFCFATAFASDATVALRGSGSSINENRRNLAEEKVILYRCDSDNQRITSTISNRTEVLEDSGLDIRICFQVSGDATSDNLSILKIDDFTFTKDRTNGDLAAAGPRRQIPSIIRQQAADSGVVMSTDFTEIFCEPGSEICALETRLTGFFFLTSGTIQGKGSVMMQRGKADRRELQQMDRFEDVFIELDFTGGGRAEIPPHQRIIMIISVILVLFLLCLCGSVIFCCIAGMCCFAGRDKRLEDTDDDDVEEVSVKIEWAPNMKRSKKGYDEEDMSETESLEDDQYWDDDIALAEAQEIEEESPRKGSRRKSKKHKSFEDHDREEGKGSRRKSKKNMEEVVPIQDTEEQPPKSKKKKRKSKRIE